MKNMEKLMEKKKSDGPMDPKYKDAKMSMLKALRDEMSGMMAGDLKSDGMKKVSVASDSKEGLESGLEKAHEMLGADDHDSNSDQLGQDEADEHDVQTHNNEFGVTPEMEEHAEEGDSVEPEHEGEMEHELSDEDAAHLEAILAEHKAKKGKF